LACILALAVHLENKQTNNRVFSRQVAALFCLQNCRTTAAVKDLGNANKHTPLYSPLPFHVLGNGAGFFPQLQVGTSHISCFTSSIAELLAVGQTLLPTVLTPGITTSSDGSAGL
jgi:hypothetical protein